MGDFWTAVGAIAAVIAAIAASFAGFFTYRIMQAGQEQVKVSLDSERDAQLPVLMPTAAIWATEHFRYENLPEEHIKEVIRNYDREKPFAHIALTNAGPGIALNVWGVIFEPEPESDAEKVTGQHHFHRYTRPITTGADIFLNWTGVGLPFVGDAKLREPGAVKRYKLYAPSKPGLGNLFMGAIEYNARLTLTYSDIFGRKHAAIYDQTTRGEWETVAYLRNIPQDLGDLIRERQSRIPVTGSPDVRTITPQ